MIKIYISPSCASCRKVRAWFKDQKIPFAEINILKDEISDDEIKEMLNKSLDGTDEIISKKSKAVSETNADIDSMSISELIKFIQANPTALKRPIIVDDEIIQVGYNSDDIEIFEKHKKRILSAKHIASETCTCENCTNYKNCDHHFSD